MVSVISVDSSLASPWRLELAAELFSELSEKNQDLILEEMKRLLPVAGEDPVVNDESWYH